MSFIRWCWLISAFVPLVSCGQQSTDLDEEVKKLYKNTVPVVSMEDAQNWKSAALLDTRERPEFDVSHIPNAMFVGYDDFDINSLSYLSKNDTIIVYCSVGYRSERIGEQLQVAGFQNVFNLYGGIFNWKNNDGVVVSSTDTTQQVHTYNKRWSRFLKKGEKVF